MGGKEAEQIVLCMHTEGPASTLGKISFFFFSPNIDWKSKFWFLRAISSMGVIGALLGHDPQPLVTLDHLSGCTAKQQSVVCGVVPQRPQGKKIVEQFFKSVGSMKALTWKGFVKYRRLVLQR